MKKALTILFIIFSLAVSAQNNHPQSNSHTNEDFRGTVEAEKGFINGRFIDTVTANKWEIKNHPGAQIVVGNTIYLRDSTVKKWIVAGGYGLTASNITILNDSSISICNSNSCDTFKFTNIVVNNFSVINDSTIIVCDGNNTCDTINTNPTVFVKSYVDSTKIIDDIIYYYINGNAYNGGNISNFVYNIVDSLADTKVTIENGTIISGIRVSYDSLLTFSITSGYYRLNDSTYYYGGGSVTLPAADATNPTIDAIILDTTGVTVLQGVPAANPASPQVIGLQILLTNVTVNANATTPVGISNTSIIYDENTETTTSSTMTADFNDVAQPFHLIKDISATAGSSGSYQQFLFGSVQSSIDYTNITLHIRLNASLSKKSDLSIQFFNGTANVSQSIILGTNYGFNKNLTGAYQTVVIPISDFNFYSSNFNIVRLTFTGNSFSPFYTDYIVLQAGVSGGGSSTFTQIQSDWSQTVNTQPDYIKNKPVVYTKTQTDSISALKLNTSDTTNKWIPKGTYFPIGVHKPIIAIDSFDIGLDSFNLKELRYSLAQRDTTNWTDTTLIDKRYLNARISAFVTGAYHLPYNGTSTDYLGGDTAYHPLPTIPAQFNPIGGTNITLSGSYPNITFNASSGGSSLWTQNTDSSIYYKKAPVLIGTDVNDGHTLRVNGSVSFNLGSDSTGDLLYRNSTGGLTPLRTGTAKQSLHPDGLGGYVWKDTTAAIASAWSVTGNSGTTAGTNFLGTTDNANLVFKRNSVQSGLIDSSGTKSTTFGFGTGINNTQTISAFGYKSLAVNTGVNNSAFGANSLLVNITGNNNSAFGVNALTANTSGTYNVGIGAGALSTMSTGSYNVAVGGNAMLSSTGSYGVAIGTAVMSGNTGAGNIGIGDHALVNGTGGYNVAIGFQSLGNGTVSGNYNVAFGRNAGNANSSGAYNIYIGDNAGSFNTTTSNQIFIGPNNGFGTNILSQKNITFIYGQTATSSDDYLTTQIMSLNGRVGINNPSPTSYLHLARGTAGAGTSPLKFRKPISVNVTGASGTGATVTLTFGTQTSEIFTRGSYVTISGVTPTGYNGTYKISNVTTTAISFTNTETGAYVSGGIISQGSFMTTPEAGAEEFDGANLAITDSTNTRYLLAKTLTTTATLDFGSTAAQTSSELTITLTGASDGDVVLLGIPNASSNANSTFTARVSAANTISVKFNNYSSAAIDPASGTFRVSILRY